MGKVKKNNIPHNVKERIRHQNLQKLLNELADRVPKPSSQRKESKDTKLRRIILYMKFLEEKTKKLKNSSHSLNGKKTSSVPLKESKVIRLHKDSEKAMSHSDQIYRKAQIVFLKKCCPISPVKACETVSSSDECGSKSFSCEKDITPDKLNEFTVEEENTTDSGPLNLVTRIMEEKEGDSHYKEMEYIPNGNLIYCRNEEYPTTFPNSSDTGTYSSNYDIDKNSPLGNNTLVDPLSNASNMPSPECFKNLYGSENAFVSSPYSFVIQTEFPATLPPIAVFSSVDSHFPNKAEFYESESYFTNSLSDAESYVEPPNLKLQEVKSYDCSSPDQSYSTNLPSSGESNFLPSSGEWISDDTITDSGSVVESSSAEQVEPSCAFVSSPSTPSISYDIYCESKDKSSDWQPFISPKSSQVYSKSYDGNFSNFNVPRLYDDFISTNTGYESCDEPICLKQIKPEPAFDEQPKDEMTQSYHNEDFSVPQYYKDSSNHCLVIDSMKPKYEGSSCGDSLNFAQKETLEPYLPAEEISYPFKYMKPWFSENYDISK